MQDSEHPEEAGTGCSNGFNDGFTSNTSRHDENPTKDGCISRNPADNRSSRDQNPLHTDVDAAVGSVNERSLKRMKLNMEENGFAYLPPKVKPKRYDYLQYVRKNDGGTRCYAAHADYYILLRVCARAAQVDAQYMHMAMLKFEKRLAWLEKQIGLCLHLRPGNHSPQPNLGAESPQEKGESHDFSKFKSNEDGKLSEDIDDSLDFSKYKFVI